MNLVEAAKFLTVSAALTGREPSEEQAVAWSTVLDDIPLDAALAALKAHYRASRFPVMPADIVDQVEAARAATAKAEQRAASIARRRAANAAHRRQTLADHGYLRDEDVLWEGVGWAGDDQPDDSLRSRVPESTIASRSAR